MHRRPWGCGVAVAIIESDDDMSLNKIVAISGLIVSALAIIYVVIFALGGFMVLTSMRTYIAPLIVFSSLILNFYIFYRSQSINNIVVIISVILTIIILCPALYVLLHLGD